MLARPSRPPSLVPSLLLGGVAAALLGLPVASAVLASRAAPPDPCAVAFDLSALSARERGLVARRTLACSDLAHGRITAAAYRAQIATIDAAWTIRPPAAPAQTQWASTVRDVSTQYSATSWSANQVLGAPNVFPGSGDNAHAWASLGADDREEWIEVGYAQPMHAGAVEVYETFNPGAITEVQLITASGERLVHQGAATAPDLPANKLRLELGCTSEPIVAVRVRLASPQVAGWNELDAIGLVPCAEP